MIPKEKAILILGSINANPDDRNLERCNISSIQFIDDCQKVHQTDLLSSWGEFGLSSIVFIPKSDSKFFISSGRSIFYIDSDKKTFEKLIIERTRGIHEMSIINNKLWISNSFFDEVIEYDYLKKETINRYQLIPNRTIASSGFKKKMNNTERVNKFHCNQIFETFDREIALLVHHTAGIQKIKRLAQKLVKSQGDGGIIYLDPKKNKKLKLKAPHSIRLINNQYWVFNSGHGELLSFSKDWRPLDTIKLNGWGRGADFVSESNTFFAGISAPRSRYLKFLDDKEQKNKIIAIDLSSKLIRNEWTLNKLEQVNNLYLVKLQLIESLERMNRVLEEEYAR